MKKEEEVATLPRRGSIILAVKDKEAQEGELKETEKKAYCPNPECRKTLKNAGEALKAHAWDRPKCLQSLHPSMLLEIETEKFQAKKDAENQERCAGCQRKFRSLDALLQHAQAKLYCFQELPPDLQGRIREWEQGHSEDGKGDEATKVTLKRKREPLRCPLCGVDDSRLEIWDLAQHLREDHSVANKCMTAVLGM